MQVAPHKKLKKLTITGLTKNLNLFRNNINKGCYIQKNNYIK